ncbi:protoporphyrinogen oxidase [soil metagenome]
MAEILDQAWDSCHTGTVRIVVIGAGLGGLTAAHDLASAGHEVQVLEASDRVGGKLHGVEVAGSVVDVGAEAMLARRPEGIDLATRLGLPLVHPTAAASQVLSHAALRPLPPSMMGVPLDQEALRAAGVLTPAGLRRALAPEPMPVIEGDISVGELVEVGFGAEVVDRLVEPLLGGVYAGHARKISTRAAVPQLLTGRPIPKPKKSAEPVFAAIPGGMAALPRTLAEGLDVRLETPVRTPEDLPDADGYVLALPAGPAAHLLADLVPAAALELRQIDYASVAVITFAFPHAAVQRLRYASGFLVPPIEGRTIKASTFSFAKWGWVHGLEHAYLRTSIGRAEQTLPDDDDDLILSSLVDLAELAYVNASPIDVHVQRWNDGLPQYAVGHLERVARIRAAIQGDPPIAVCGAAYDGVGIPAVIASGRAAAREVLRQASLGSSV